VIPVSKVINAVDVVEDFVCRVEFGVGLVAVRLLVMMGLFSELLV
jgi:hypothetical protein